MGWSFGPSNSATFGSRTIERILLRTNSDAVSFAALFTRRSVYEYRKLMLPPSAHFASYFASRSSGVASNADLAGGGNPAMPNGVSYAAARRAPYSALWFRSISGSIGPLRAGKLKFAVRWNT